MGEWHLEGRAFFQRAPAYKSQLNPSDMFNRCTLVFSRLLRKQLGALSGEQLEVSKVVEESVKSCSGPARTHDILANTKPVKVGPRVEHTEQFLCSGGVDAGRLLDLARKGLYSTARTMGGNVLLEEQWSCSIRPPKLQKRDEFKVTIRYSATVARSFWPDAQRPIGVDAAKGIKGLMTILDRHAELC